MGMLMAMTLLKQKEEAEKRTAEPVPEVKDEEIPFAKPEKPVEEPVREQKKPTTRKPSTATRRRKTTK